MTVATYAIGKPLAAVNRGGDCRARDLTQAHNVFGPHRFAATTDCQISNGLLRLTVGATGIAPTLTVSAWVGAGTGPATGDYYLDTYSDTYAGVSHPNAAGWSTEGTVTIDSPALTALLTGVRLMHVSAKSVTILLRSPVMAGAYVTLRRGERHFHVQHGSTRPPFVVTTRRVSWADTSLTGATAGSGRVEETAPLTNGYVRFVADLDPGATANAGAFSVTSPSVCSARFGVGIGTSAARDTASDLHGQLSNDDRRHALVVA